MATAPWTAATAGQPGQARQINQLLGGHDSTWVYAGGTQQSAETTGAGVYVTTDAQYLAQAFTTGAAQTAIGVVYLQVSTVGGSPISATITPLVVSLYASLGGAPTGGALASAIVPEQYVYSAGFWVPVPLVVTGLTPSTVYQLVLSPAGTASAYYVWQESNQVTGASTSPDGTTWSAQSYGLMYQVYDQSGVSGMPLLMVDDDGARWTVLSYNSAGQPATIAEYVQPQSGTALYQSRAFTYSSGQLVGVA